MVSRREFLQHSLAAGIGSVLLPAAIARAAEPPSLKIASFRVDASPPKDHPLCGGWITPVVGMDDPEEAIGFVLTGAGDPIVVCAVDWTGILNQTHIQFRQALAQAAGTTPDRVAIQCVHQHNAPFVCRNTQTLLDTLGEGIQNLFPDFLDRMQDSLAKAVEKACQNLRPVTHIAHGQGKVEKVASNRRILGADGKLADWRGSASKVERHWELPEGQIDPYLKTVAFYDGETKLVACHYYATHPMSYYGDGKVCSDFVGLARKRRQAEEPGCTHIYFTGASGNIAAGKYNNGTPEARVELTNRIHAGMVASEANLSPMAVASASWSAAPVLLPVRDTLNEARLIDEMRNRDNALANRIRPAMMVSWMRRCEEKLPIVISALRVNDATMLHLPAESFLEYQLGAQAAAPNRFVATAAYGDGGPWYIPVETAYPQGGYEVSVALTDPAVEGVLSGGAKQVVGG